mmetsp:Transcript_26404/g.47613  ORF Transcript_26404/g.47613 Transcript_26404/m.47613 type:complete len:118 (-) Transcript_26404:173-526(-)
MEVGLKLQHYCLSVELNCEGLRDLGGRSKERPLSDLRNLNAVEVGKAAGQTAWLDCEDVYPRRLQALQLHVETRTAQYQMLRRFLARWEKHDDDNDSVLHGPLLLAQRGRLLSHNDI